MERTRVAASYLAALGLPAPPHCRPDLAMLRELVRRHVATFSFSSLGPRLRDDLPLELGALHERLVVGRRGGYCFEQNGLFFDVLDELGFTCALYLARVIHDQDTHPPLTHRITIVDFDDGRNVADVGFGPYGPPIPVPLSEREVTSDGRTYRVHERKPGELHMQVIRDGAFYSLYRFELVRYGPADCELGHFYSHRHPDAFFVNNLVGSRILDDEIRSLHQLEYRVIRQDSDEKAAIESPERLRAILSDDLGLVVSADEAARLYAEARG